MSSEFERIRALRGIFGSPPPAVRTGIGDDCAVLDLAVLGQSGGSQLVWTIDACVEHVHFERRLIGLEELGWRSLMAAASDLAAMASRPVGALVALSLPDDVDDAGLWKLASGQRDAAGALGCAVIGGNLSRAAALSIDTTLIGVCARPVLRSGAHAGDALVLCGSVGLAAAGLSVCKAGDDTLSANDAAAAEAVHAWRHPIARIGDGICLGKVASALIDVSDGLVQDVGHIAAASAVRIVIDGSRIVSEALRRACASRGLDPLQTALTGGEDYALIATVPSDQVPQCAHVIGHCARGEGVWLADTHGERRIRSGGYAHFASSA